MESLAVSLFCSILLTVLIPSWGLDFHFNHTADPQGGFCGQIRCYEDTNSTDPDIFSIVGMSIYDITTADTVKLASIAVFEHGIYIDPAREAFLGVGGTVSQLHADLAVSFRNDTDCQFGEFLCELNYINKIGQPDVMEITESATTNSGECCCPSCATLQKQVTQTLADQIKIKDELDDKVVKLTARVATNEACLQNVTILQNRIVKLESKLDFLHKQGACDPRMLRQPNVTRVPVNIGDGEWALCDPVTDNLAWIVIQRRTLGDTNFYRNWTEYVRGFGSLDGDYWLGLENIHRLTQEGYQELWIDMVYNGVSYTAVYQDFRVGPFSSNYLLNVGNYIGGPSPANDSLSYHSNSQFSTFDADHDNSASAHCADIYKGGWWYNECYETNLNGLWGDDSDKGMTWKGIVEDVSLSYSEMKIRLVEVI